MKKSIFFKLAFAILVISGCSKDLDLTGGPNSNNTPKFSHFDSASLVYIEVPAGRFFLYKDSVSETIDSVIVSISEIIPYSVGGIYGDPIMEADNYRLIFSNFLDGQPDSAWYSGIAGTEINKDLHVTYDSTYILSEGEGSIPVFWYPFVSAGDRKYKFIATLVVEGVTYKDVHSFFATNGRQTSEASYEAKIYYWVKGIGIIKRVTWLGNSVKADLLVKYW